LSDITNSGKIETLGQKPLCVPWFTRVSVDLADGIAISALKNAASAGYGARLIRTMPRLRAVRNTANYWGGDVCVSTVAIKGTGC